MTCINIAGIRFTSGYPDNKSYQNLFPPCIAITTKGFSPPSPERDVESELCLWQQDFPLALREHGFGQ